MQDIECTEREIEEMLALEKLNAKDDSLSDEEDGGAGLIIGIVIIVLVVIALLVVGLVCYLRKRSKRNAVTVLVTHNLPPTTNNSHQALPDVATEDGIQWTTHRSEEKGSDRKKIIV